MLILYLTLTSLKDTLLENYNIEFYPSMLFTVYADNITIKVENKMVDLIILEVYHLMHGLQ